MVLNTVKIKDIPDLEKQISEKKIEAETYQDKLNTSPTALGGEGKPTAFDIANQESLQRIQGEIQTLDNKRLTAKWYGDEKKDLSADVPNPPQGFIGKTLDFVLRPVLGVIGATKHVVGQGKGTLWEDIADNMMRDKNFFGDVLRTAGVPGSVAAPLGFALDIFADPVNWVTMGTGALIPRLGMGVYRGVKTGEGIVRGLSVAAKSGVLEKAATVGRWTPFLRKSEAMGKLGGVTLKATEGWETLRGVTTAELALQKGIGIGKARMPLGDIIQKGADLIPGGRTFLKTMWYDPKEWIRLAYFKDIIKSRLVDTGVDVTTAAKALLKDEKTGSNAFEQLIREVGEKKRIQIAEKPVGFDINVDAVNKLVTSQEVDRGMAALNSIDPAIVPELNRVAPGMVKELDEASLIAKDGRPLGENAFTTTKIEENIARIEFDSFSAPKIPLEVLEKIVKARVLDDTGIKWFDNMIQGIRNLGKRTDANGKEIISRGAQFMDKLDQIMALFRTAVVGANPPTHVYAIGGNFSMRQLLLGNISANFMKMLGVVFRAYHNRPGAALELEKILKKTGRGEEAVRAFMEANQTAARASFGGKLNFMNAEKNSQEILAAAFKDKDIGLSLNATKEEVSTHLQNALDQLEKEFPVNYRALKKSMEKSTKIEAGTSGVFEAFEKSGVVNPDVASGMLSAEAFEKSAAIELAQKIKDHAKDGNVGWKLLDLWVNKMPSLYETHDQIFKLATFSEAVVFGHTENEIRRIAHFVDISAEDLAIGKYKETFTLKNGKEAFTGRTLYRLSPKSALELANVMYLNYNAMPAAIRVLRNFPLLNSPFISFMYGMTLKTGQSLAYNPSAFNKIGFAMNEFGGTKTPLEKKALGTEIYSYFNKPGMYRIPFFDANPLYLNLANIIPYYSLGMFGPTETDYGSSWRGGLATAIQKSPFMKDPIGNSIFENLLLPAILSDVAQPQGQFGQPLYPYDATLFEKAAYGVRSLAEAWVPGVAAYAGLLTPEAAAEYIPKYRWRQLSRATAGKNLIGVRGKEPALSRTFRGVLQATGIPLQAPMSTQFTQGQK